MVIDRFMFNIVGLLRFGKTNKLNRNNSTLMQKLEETMLSISSRLAKIDNSSLIFNDIAL